MTRRRVGRRRVLAALGSGTLALAGCLGAGNGRSDGSGMTDRAGTDGTDGEGNATGTAAQGTPDHTVWEGIDGQPAQGPEVGAATATVVAFEDPSCPRCAAFHRETVPRLLSDLVEPGTATYVVRPYPIVYEWGKPATRALWATYEQDAESFWGLLDHYFRTQGRFDSDNVVDLTRSWLEAETSVDVEAVVEAASADGFPEPVQTNLDVGDRANVSGTPTVFLFRDGAYRTRATGSVSYDLVASALNV
ncbi:DsbA family protein [Halomarina salina]|uniref:DsbA family protein n=1 Tax=Halomarina salina TaxID=1872699 RepID=A0ABD5RMS5_9EURY|nr:thioredoxin domain-containing protein [Halomarina salina]